MCINIFEGVNFFIAINSSTHKFNSTNFCSFDQVHCRQLVDYTKPF